MDKNSPSTVSGQGRGRGNNSYQNINYRHGNGPPRKYETQTYTNEEDGQYDNRDSGYQKRFKKPEQQFYTAKQQQQQQQSSSQYEQSQSNYGNKYNNKQNFLPSDNVEYSSNRHYNNNKHLQQPPQRYNHNNIRSNIKYHENGNESNEKFGRNDYHQDFRGTSEPRTMQFGNLNHYSDNLDKRQRDTRSVEPNLVRDKRPPMNMRDSTERDLNNKNAQNIAMILERYRLPANYATLPPRLRKKHLQKSGLPLSLLEELSTPIANEKESDNYQHHRFGGQNQNYGNYNQQPPANWSQTLPMSPRSGGRGRGSIDSRPETPVEIFRSRSRSSDIGYDDYEYNNDRPNSRGGHYRNDQQRYNKDFRSSNRSLNYHDNYNNRTDFTNKSSNSNYQKHNVERNFNNDSNNYEYRQQNFNRNNNNNNNNNNRRYNSGENEQHNYPKYSVNERIQGRNFNKLTVDDLSKNVENISISPQVTPSPNVDGKFDWSEEVEKATKKLEQKLNYLSQDPMANKSTNIENPVIRHRNRSNSNSSRNQDNDNDQNLNRMKYDQINDERESFKIPHSKTYRNRSRRNSQSSIGVSRESSEERSYPMRKHSNRKNSYNNAGYVSRENSMDRRDNFPPRSNRSRRNSGKFSRENSTERSFWSVQRTESSNWRSEAKPESKSLNQFDNKSKAVDIQQTQAGIIKIPDSCKTIDDTTLVQNVENKQNSGQQKILFDPKNPNKPIVITPTQTRNYIKQSDVETSSATLRSERIEKNLITTRASLSNQNINLRPIWYDPNSKQYQYIHKKELIDELQKFDMQIQLIIGSNSLFSDWDSYVSIRENLQSLWKEFLTYEMKFSQQENVDTHFWKLLYHNIIDLLRKQLNEDINEDNKQFYKDKLMEIIENGTKYLENLILHLENSYNFALDDYTGSNANNMMVKQSKFIGLVLVSVQKLLISLGDLARYKEQINETNNYGRAKQWYTKAQQVQPKNGRPYNSLAVLSVISKRKMEAVYYFMRSIMSSNPFQSAKESLVSLIDEIRKKYESAQRKREEKNRARLKEKEHRFGGPLRQETWIHPESGRRFHRTSRLDLDVKRDGDTSEEEELCEMDPIELNKRFILSYLHVQGKLITKVGMETFTQCAIQMLREFRALLRHSPLVITSHRLIQLMALNMFAIDCTQLKDPDIVPGARSEIQEQAISIALLMFGIILDRFIIVLKESISPGSTSTKTYANVPVITLGGENIIATQNDNHHHHHNKHKRPKSQNWDDKVPLENVDKAKNDNSTINEPLKKLNLPEDARVMLPAIKVWCDWLNCHQNVWNPPPLCSDYKLGSTSSPDPWNALGILLTILESVDTNKQIFSNVSKEDYEIVRLQEDITLAGFTPLTYDSFESYYCHRDEDIELAQSSLRILKLINFCSNTLCTCDPPVLQKTSNNTLIEYRSVVQNRTDESSDSESLLESFSDDENDINCDKNNDNEFKNDNNFNGSNNSDTSKTNNDNCNNMDIINKNNSNEVDQNLTKSNQSNESDFTNNKNGNVNFNNNSNDSNNINNYNNNLESAAEIRKLRQRKDELEKKHEMQERDKQLKQEILRNSIVALHIEVRPKYLVPDTNCFVDFIDSIKAIAAHPIYQLMVPLVVINELEGLSRGGRPNSNSAIFNTTPLTPKLDIFTSCNALKTGQRTEMEHAIHVAESSKNALLFLKDKSSNARCVTTKGSILKTSAFTYEDDNSEQVSNDDKILTTALNLCKTNLDKKSDDATETKYLVREVVLLTTDRNLRVKALSRDVPVRDLPEFIKWAGLDKSPQSSGI